MVWGGTGNFVSSSTEYPDEAAALALYLASEPFIREYMADGAIPTLTSVAEELVPALGIPQNAELYIESASDVRPVQAPTKYAEIAVIVERVLADLYTDPSLDVETTLQAADDELNLILSE